MTNRTVAFPPGVDGGTLLAPLNSAAWELKGPAGADYRRAITRKSPLLFAITYLSHYLRDAVTGHMSFCPLHLDLAVEGRQWVTRKPRRHGWVAPRESAKSVWLLLILPLWALAHGHVRFFLAFGGNAEQATGHLANIRLELETNELLLRDFPELAPQRIRGSQDTSRTVMRNGATLAARGMGANSLGIRSGADRPDLIVGDDLEPGEASYTPAAKEKREASLVGEILPMNSRAVVQVTGTVTMQGSLMHNVVDAAKGRPTAAWIADEGFTPHYYPAIIEGPPRRSLWPQRWPLAELEAAEHTRSFALNMANDPQPDAARAMWRPELIRSPARFTPTKRVLSVDVAVTESARSDFTTLVVAGLDASGRHAVIEHAEQGRWTGTQLRERIWALCKPYPTTLKTVVVEANQGGSRWREVLSPMPAGVTLVLYSVHSSKRTRILQLLDHYERMAVWHARPLQVLEDQQLQWPHSRNDDLLDAEAGALRWLWTGEAGD